MSLLSKELQCPFFNKMQNYFKIFFFYINWVSLLNKSCNKLITLKIIGHSHRRTLQELVRKLKKNDLHSRITINTL